MTTQLSAKNKLRGAYYNSNGRTQRYDVGCTATSGNRVSCRAGRQPALQLGAQFDW